MELKQKLFIRYAPYVWPKLPGTDKIDYLIEDKTENKRQGLSQADKKAISRYKEEFKQGIGMYPPSSNSGIPNTDDTEYLSQISLKISDNKGYLVYSKKLDGDNRFCYMIYSPIKHPNPSKSDTCVIRIVIYSCKGHTRPDGGSYWDPEPKIMRRIKSEIRAWRQRNGLPPLSELN